MKKALSFILVCIIILSSSFIMSSAASGIKTNDSTKYASRYVRTKTSYKSSKGDTQTYTYKYDKNFNPTNLYYKDSNGDSVSSVYTYDSKGRLTRYAYNYNGLKYIYTYTYNSSGNVTKSTCKSDCMNLKKFALHHYA